MKKEKERALQRSPTVLMIIVAAKNASSDFDMAQESKFLNALVLFLPIQELLNKVNSFLGIHNETKHLQDEFFVV